MIASVAGKISAAPRPSAPRPRSVLPIDRALPANATCAEDEQPGDERPFAAVLVADAAGGEHQTGEHEQVGVDDPLQLTGRGLEFARERGSATFTIVPSSTVTNTAMQTTASAAQRRG